MPRTVADPVATASAIRRIARDADVVVSHLPTTAVGMLAARVGRPLVLVYHASLWRELLYDRAAGLSGTGRALESAFRAAERIAVARADRIFVLSEFSRAQLVADHPGAAGRVRLVSGGVDTQRFVDSPGRDAARAALGVERGPPLLLAVRRLEPRMGLGSLLAAVRLLRRTRDVRLAVVGSGSLDRQLHALAQGLGLEDCVRFVGSVTDDELPLWYRAADLSVVPSLAYEGFGLATAESLASGTPVVGTPVGATPELLGSVDAGLVAGGTSPPQLAEAIDRALARRSAALERRCRAYAEEHLAWPVVAESWERELAAAAGCRVPARSRDARPRIGLVAPLPPQIGGVPSVAGWLLDNEALIGWTYVPFDLWRPPWSGSGGRLTARTLALQGRNLVRFVRWLPRAPRLVHYCVSANSTGLARDLTFVALLRAAGRTTIAHVHNGTELERAGRSRLHGRALRLLARASGSVVAVAPSLAEDLGRIGVQATPIMNPVRFEASNGRRAGSNGSLRVLFVGAYSEAKGVGDLVRALDALRAGGTDATLRIVGRPRYAEDERALRTLVSELGVTTAVELTGQLDADGVRSEYDAADVFALPSTSEGLPMSVLEAMACGLPVVAARTGGVPDVVADGRTGLLVEPGDVRGIEHALRDLAARPGRRARMGEAGRRRALELAGGPAIAADWSGLYERLVSSV
jgi:glycosyltransferase involved in cell wall biosynthesis